MTHCGVGGCGSGGAVIPPFVIPPRRRKKKNEEDEECDEECMELIKAIEKLLRFTVILVFGMVMPALVAMVVLSLHI